ncbi:ribose-phosphate pyrophosphokinase [Desulfobulbus propionicus DSM 2032]|uniref:ribose-phosphate diphosphokinase n=1 Tax=Desulfobulbus propionicus (strain ATCC 33891 / DSM 2032 / VKM B-1956 / 1pr3) TaxID=577650 RepID=A0A7U3YKI8_DESPD|nr:ribose-phosphate diphosphokinase [Desulfobulbus propionicus]ADW17084.1 ribose-phosphate pyrophosphokinase [Desulfobulbus propionicus DSM 2032]
MPRRKNIILIANSSATQMAAKVARELDIPVTEMITRTFADGELYHAFPRDIAGHDLVIIANTPDDCAHQELIDLVTGARYWNALSVNVVIPYLGYSTMERAKPESGEIPKGITRTRQIFRARPDYVAFLDLHSESVMHAHSGEVRTRHLWTEQVAAEKIRQLHIDNPVLVSPDYGFSKRVARLAGLLGCPHTAANKDRYDVDQTIVGQLSGAVRGRTAIICDDMIRTGGSMLQTVDRCYQAGAVGVMVMATHLVLAGNARERFLEKGIGCIIGADTYPGRESDDLLQVYSVAPVIADELKGYFRLH